jgi:multidrug efflux system membrane fusion protein
LSIVTRGISWAVVVAAALTVYGAYNPAFVAARLPAAAPLALRLHDYLPGFLAATSAAPVALAAVAPRPPVSVVTALAQRENVPWRINEIGTVQPIASVALRPHFDATVDKVLVADGAEVKAGDVLIQLDARQTAAQLGGAQAQLAKDVAQLDQNDRDVTRYTDLVARNATPIINLDNAKTASATTRAAIQGDKAAIENLQVQLGWYTVTAPISGRVGVVAIKQGNIAKAGDNSAAGVFATINQISPIYVSFSVAQSLLPTLREAMGTGAQVVATPQGSKASATGKLSILENTVDTTTGTILAHAVFENADELLWPGQLCDVTLTLKVEPDTVVTPREAIQIGQSGNYVFTVADGVAHVRPVEVGRTEANQTVITKGLQGGESVVVDGALLLFEGAKVELRNPTKGAS